MRTPRSALISILVGAVLPITGGRCQEPARRLLDELTLEQRAAQLIVSFSYSRMDDDYRRRDELRAWIEEPGIGGVVLSLGDAETAATLVDDLQRRAAIPLLIAGNFEDGVAFCLKDTSDFGSAMLVGATRSSRLAYAMGRATAEEARALGFHWNYAPVLDVNLNPDNPIIVVRSFGEDPALVGRLGAAFVRGTQSAGVIATGKHFPGHGDVAVDSHVSLPTLVVDGQRLEEVELVPFQAAVSAGLRSIMTGHLAVPALDTAGVPATLSRQILIDLLRERLGFDGLIVTDALTMDALEDVVDERSEAAIRALLAGADVLLSPPDPVAVRDAVVAAVREGRVPQSRVDQACLRVLRAKVDAGLLDGAGMPDPRWSEVVMAPRHLELADEIARRGTTIVRDPLGIVPLRSERALLVRAYAGETDGRGDALSSALASRFDDIEVYTLIDGAEQGTAIAAVRAAAGESDVTIVCAVFPRAGRTAPELEDLFAAVAEAPRAVVAVLGNPYATTPVGETTSFVCSYHDSATAERSVAAVLLGDGPAFGRLPVSLPDVAALGDGVSWMPATPAVLPRTAPENEGLAPDLTRQVREHLERAIADRAFPGAVALVARRGRVVSELAAGHETWEPDAKPIELDDLWDLASLTKVCATTSTTLRLIDDGRLALDTPVHQLLPEFRGGDKEAVTIRHLLSHTAGFPPFRRFFADLRGREDIVAAAAATPLEQPPGTKAVYSDIGMIMLMACVESVTDESFDLVARREVFDPLGMRTAQFATTGSPIDAVPTEIDELRKGVVRGEVHDENAWAMGGVSGHAGLFASADDVVRVGLAFLGGGRGWLSPALARSAVERAGVVEDSRRALGWGTFVPGGSGGSLLSPRAFGHTGFTGTSIWCDPDRDLVIVLLSNRVHPTRDNQRHKAARAGLADLVVRAIRD